ncbi:IS1 family transposase, partial [Escherichia coli]|uniref:IS1 family transposase n=1 Tax=Escherichia coli TaxID=562 RepID=UPI001CEC6697
FHRDLPGSDYEKILLMNTPVFRGDYRWPLYESRLKGKLHVISKRYTQRIERHNLNLRQHLARLGRKSLSFSKSVELHDKVIGHYLNIKHYQ